MLNFPFFKTNKVTYFLFPNKKNANNLQPECSEIKDFWHVRNAFAFQIGHSILPFLNKENEKKTIYSLFCWLNNLAHEQDSSC